MLIVAYTGAMYLAGSNLSRTQYVLANIMYLLVMANAIGNAFSSAAMINLWVVDAALPNQSDLTLSLHEFRGLSTVALGLALTSISIWFGATVRSGGKRID